MLKQRVITAIVLAALFLAAVFYLPVIWIAIAFGAVGVACAWEWAPLAGWQSQWARIAYGLILLGLLVGLWVFTALGATPARDLIQPWIGLACLFWSIALLLVKSYPGGTWAWRSAPVRSLVGWLVLASTWLSMIYLLSLKNGPLLVILMVVAVAAADIGAYFAGRQWGRHQLAPSVSPGKTWEGMWGGLVAVLAISLLVWNILPTSYGHIPIASLLLIGLAVAGASVLGDLTVSMMKRSTGVKDTGSLLPGHGGLLDRIDSLCGAAPVYTLGLMLMGH